VHDSAPQLVSGRSGTIDRLTRSLTDVLYAASITPDTYHYRSPAAASGLEWLGTWSVAENLAHLAVYEEHVAAPILEAIVADRDATAEVTSVIESDYDTHWRALSKSTLDEIAQRLSAARSRQVDAVSAMSDDLFQARTTTLWTDVLAADGHSAAWVAAKTFQHTWEHGNSILCIALFAPS
jgi:DinB superfamily